MSDYAPSSVLDFKFRTSSAGTGATLSGTPAVSVYKNNSTTQSTSGVALTVDFDGVTGLNNVRVDTSADGTFYSAGSSFQIVFTAGTVGGVSVAGHVVEEFTLNRSSVLSKLPTSLTGDGLLRVDVTAIDGDGQAASNAAGFFSDVSSGAALNSQVWSLGDRELTSGANIQLPSNGLANVTAWTVALTGNITGNVSGSVGSVTSAITLPSIPNNWLTAAGMASDVTTELQAGLATATNLTAVKTIMDKVDGMLVLDGSVYKYTANALEEAPSGGGSAPTAAEVAAEVDEVLSAAHGPGSWESATSGMGAYSITATVTDGEDPLQNAVVRVTDGVESFVAQTDVDGEAQFSLDAATYTVSITKPGYSFTPVLRTVTGNQAGTLTNDLEMTQVIAPVSPDPTLCAVSASSIIRPNGEMAINTPITFTLLVEGPVKNGGLVAGRVVEDSTDGNGDLLVNLLRNDLTEGEESMWNVKSPLLDLDENITLTSSSFDLGSLVG